jgi:hypothetical protein
MLHVLFAYCCAFFIVFLTYTSNAQYLLYSFDLHDLYPEVPVSKVPTTIATNLNAQVPHLRVQLRRARNLVAYLHKIGNLVTNILYEIHAQTFGTNLFFLS